MTTPAAPLPAFAPRRPVSDLDHVYGELKQSFIIGEFAPGQRLTLPELAAAFGTSQMPVREAANRLVVARAIEALPRRSLRVPEATPERLSALLPLRLQLEGEAAALAARSANAGLAAELRAIDGQMRAMDAADDIKTYLRLNQQFHFALYQASDNDHLVDLIELLWMRYGPLLSILRSSVLSATGAARHAEIIAAVAAGQPEAARSAICADISEAAASIRRAMGAADPA